MKQKICIWIISSSGIFHTSRSVNFVIPSKVHFFFTGEIIIGVCLHIFDWEPIMVSSSKSLHGGVLANSSPGDDGHSGRVGGTYWGTAKIRGGVTGGGAIAPAISGCRTHAAALPGSAIAGVMGRSGASRGGAAAAVVDFPPWPRPPLLVFVAVAPAAALGGIDVEGSQEISFRASQSQIDRFGSRALNLIHGSSRLNPQTAVFAIFNHGI